MLAVWAVWGLVPDFGSLWIGLGCLVWALVWGEVGGRVWKRRVAPIC